MDSDSDIPALDEVLHGIAASAFNPDLAGAEAVLAELLPGRDPAEIAGRIRCIRAERDDGLGRSPAPAERLEALRAELAKSRLTGFLVPLADEHQGEFIPPRAQRLAWLTGFGGSAGMAVVLSDSASIFVDGRYTLQVRTQVDTAAFVPRHLAETPADRWLAETLKKGDRLGFDPWLHTPAGIERLRAACKKAGAELVAVDANPIDAVWSGQPQPPLGPVLPHPAELAGASSAEKRGRIGKDIAAAGATAAVLSAPDSVAWLLNVRGCDVSNTPLPLGYAVIAETGAVDWFVDPRKITRAVHDKAGQDVTLRPPDAFAPRLAALGAAGAAVLLDPATCPEAIRQRLEAAGATIVTGADPCTLPKARKTDAELSGARAAHVRDGAALSTFLAWLAAEGATGAVTEMSAVRRLYDCRAVDPAFRGNSFDTISGSGPNGAIVHYRVGPETDRALMPGDVYLVDSGGQYADGTTDVTRTVYIPTTLGEVAPDDIRAMNTRVLKGHIAIATAVFPAGTGGGQLDALARRALWEAGVDYDHGTGHGVGAYLGVHEGPQRISKLGGSPPLEPGMIVSNEPGYYRAGEYGIRIENLVVVRAVDGIAGAERDMLGFETITLAPIDRALIEALLLTHPERAWLNAYHDRVRETLSPLVDPDTRRWLAEATVAI